MEIKIYTCISQNKTDTSHLLHITAIIKNEQEMVCVLFVLCFLEGGHR